MTQTNKELSCGSVIQVIVFKNLDPVGFCVDLHLKICDLFIIVIFRSNKRRFKLMNDLN